MTDSLQAPLFHPLAPKPLQEPAGLFALLLAVRRNPLTTRTERHFEEKVMTARAS